MDISFSMLAAASWWRQHTILYLAVYMSHRESGKTFERQVIGDILNLSQQLGEKNYRGITSCWYVYVV